MTFITIILKITTKLFLIVDIVEDFYIESAYVY